MRIWSRSTGAPAVRCGMWRSPTTRPATVSPSPLVALDAETGKLKWHFQFTPHDVHDWDATHVPVLVDAPVRGVRRKLALVANRNGFYYVLDRLSGQFLAGAQFAKQTWAQGLDDRGRPLPLPGKDPTAE